MIDLSALEKLAQEQSNECARWMEISPIMLSHLCDEIKSLRECKKEALELAELECGNRCNAEYNQCASREFLIKWGITQKEYKSEAEKLLANFIPKSK